MLHTLKNSNALLLWVDIIHECVWRAQKPQADICCRRPYNKEMGNNDANGDMRVLDSCETEVMFLIRADSWCLLTNCILPQSNYIYISCVPPGLPAVFTV